MSTPRGASTPGAASVPQYSERQIREMSIGGVPAANFASGFTGGAYKADRLNKFVDAVSDPPAYLKRRGEAITAINEKLDGEFLKRYQKLLNTGVPPEDAVNRAKAYVMKLSAAEYAELEMDLPADINKTAANLSYSRTTAGQNGFDPSSVEKPRRAQRTRK